ncbi:hypothetical protein [Kitasatospora sp. McL0602]|uniref:hypothetical protein n=1 Tax=Kitasatospora sp. McL0602 TaxID=3439530 RepID=UPI003F8AA4DA
MGEQQEQRPEQQEPQQDGQDVPRKAKLVFSDPLDRQSSDDTDGGWGESSASGSGGGRGLDWYLSQRPPHHG